MRWFDYVACVWASFSLKHLALLMPRKQHTWETQALVRELYWIYFFNIPTNAHTIYTSKSTKVHIKNT